jgi:hypothetical protein
LALSCHNTKVCIRKHNEELEKLKQDTLNLINEIEKLDIFREISLVYVTGVNIEIFVLLGIIKQDFTNNFKLNKKKLKSNNSYYYYEEGNK